MASIQLSSLVSHLAELAATTWHKVAVGPSRGLTFGEEGLTDHNLFELDQRHPTLTVYKFNKNEESFNGADFDWWVGNDALGWTLMRFQAKKLVDGVYAELGHIVRGQRQYDLLAQQAYNDGAWPLYCFYNGWEDGWPSHVRNVTCPKNLTPGSLDLWRRHVPGWCKCTALDHFGCAVTPAAVVQRIHRGPRQTRLALEGYLDDSVPWHRLFADAAAAERKKANANAVLAALEGSLEMLSTRAEALGPRPRRHEELPAWIAALVDEQRDEFRYEPRSRSLVIQRLTAN